jgi:hypothetical protein
MSYKDELKSPEWQKKRLEILQRDKWKCRLCDCDVEMLIVHHLCYAERGDWRGVPDKFMITVCESCNQEIHGFIKAPTPYRPKCGKPFETEKTPMRAKIASMNLHEFLSDSKPEGEGLNELAKRLESWLSSQYVDATLSTCKRVIEELLHRQKLFRRNGLYFTVEAIQHSINRGGDGLFKLVLMLPNLQTFIESVSPAGEPHKQLEKKLFDFLMANGIRHHSGKGFAGAAIREMLRGAVLETLESGLIRKHQFYKS